MRSLIECKIVLHCVIVVPFTNHNFRTTAFTLADRMTGRICEEMGATGVGLDVGS